MAEQPVMLRVRKVTQLPIFGFHLFVDRRQLLRLFEQVGRVSLRPVSTAPNRGRGARPSLERATECGFVGIAE